MAGGGFFVLPHTTKELHEINSEEEQFFGFYFVFCFLFLRRCSVRYDGQYSKQIHVLFQIARRKKEEENNNNKKKKISEKYRKEIGQLGQEFLFHVAHFPSSVLLSHSLRRLSKATASAAWSMSALTSRWTNPPNVCARVCVLVLSFVRSLARSLAFFNAHFMWPFSAQWVFGNNVTV